MRVLLSIYMIFCQCQPCVAYKSVVYKKKSMYNNRLKPLAIVGQFSIFNICRHSGCNSDLLPKLGLGTLHKKWSFPSSVNMTKFAVNCGSDHICWRNPKWKTSFFVQQKWWIFQEWSLAAQKFVFAWSSAMFIFLDHCCKGKTQISRYPVPSYIFSSL